MLHHVLNLTSTHRRLLGAAALAAMSVALDNTAQAQAAPDSENGRYSLSQVGNDVVRLDTRTGVVSTCTSKGGWACRIVPDERAALDAEIGKLQADNKKLKDQLTQRDTVTGKTDAPLAKEDSKNVSKDAAKDLAQKKSAEASPDATSSTGKIELTLPAEHQKLMTLLDKVWVRLVDMASRLQKRFSEKT